MDGSPDRPVGNSPRVGVKPNPVSIPFSLSFIDGKGRLSLRDFSSPPISIQQLELDITGLSFPFDLTSGPNRLRDRWLEAVVLDISVPLGVLRSAIDQLERDHEGLSELHIDVDRDALEIVGRFGESLESPWFVLRYVTDVAGEQDIILRPALFVLFGPPTISFQHAAAQLARLPLGSLAPVAFDLRVGDIARTALKRFLLPAGYRIPDCRKLRLKGIELNRRVGVRLTFDRGGIASASPSSTAMAIAEVQQLLRPGDDAVIEGDIEGARAHYLEALTREPGHVVIVERLAWLDATSSTRVEAARVGCERGLEGNDSPGLHAVLGSLLIGDGAFEEAASHFQSLGDHLSPLGQSRLLLLLGRLKLERDAAGAATLLESALALDPNLVDALGLLRDCYVALGQRRQLEAVAARLTAATAHPKLRGRILTDLGKLWHQQFGDVYRATDCYEQALLHEPDSPDALIGLAECHAAKGEYQAALRCLDATAKGAAGRDDKALEVFAHIRAGELWEEIGDRASASARYHRAVSIDSTSTQALERAAETDVALGRHSMAASGYATLIAQASLEGDFLKWSKSLARLVRLQLDHLHAPAAALAACERYLEARPDDGEIEALHAEARRTKSTLEGSTLLEHFEEAAQNAQNVQNVQKTLPTAVLTDSPTMAPPDAPTVMPTSGEPVDHFANLATIVELGKLDESPVGDVEVDESYEAPPSLFNSDPATDLFSAISRATDVPSKISSSERRRPSQMVDHDDVESLLGKHLEHPDDEAATEAVIERLEGDEDWTRLAAVLSGVLENISAKTPTPALSSREVTVLCHLAEVLIEGLEDRQSGAECLLRVASIVPAAEGAAHARRAAALLRHEGLPQQAADAEKLAERLASRGRSHAGS